MSLNSYIFIIFTQYTGIFEAKNKTNCDKCSLSCTVNGTKAQLHLH